MVDELFDFLGSFARIEHKCKDEAETGIGSLYTFLPALDYVTCREAWEKGNSSGIRHHLSIGLKNNDTPA